MLLLAATIVAALLTWMAFPPLEWSVLIFVAPAPFLWSLRRIVHPRHAATLGFVYGAVLFGVMLYWIGILGIIAWLPLTLALGSFFTLYALVVHWARTLSPWRWWVITVGGWALLEFIRARFPFGGFPWGSVGYAVGSLSWPRGAAQWIGASGWSVLVVAVAAGLVLLVESVYNQEFFAYPAIAVVILSAAGALWPPSADGESLDVAIIQGNTPCPRVHCIDEKELIYTSHLELTKRLEPGTVDLVVWGENSVGGRFEPIDNPEVAVAIAGEARRLDAFVMISGTRSAGEGFFINANLLFTPTGELSGEYLKRHPVPFGEYVPFRSALDWIPQLDQVPRDMVRGDRPGLFPITLPPTEDRAQPLAVTIGSVISFEGAFAREARNAVKSGARLLTVNTNEASYGRSPASNQLIAMTRMSAAENGVDIVHAAISGRSAFLDAEGSILSKTDLYTEEILFGTVRFRNAGRTVYTVVGDWVQVAAILAIAVPLVFRRQRRPQLLFSVPHPEDR